MRTRAKENFTSPHQLTNIDQRDMRAIESIANLQGLVFRSMKVILLIVA